MIFRVVDPIISLLPATVVSKIKSKESATLKDLFRASSPLLRALNWFEFGILSQMITRFGDQDCKRELEAYIVILKHYLKSRSTTEECTNTTTATPQSDPQQTPTVRVTVDREWDEGLVKQSSEERGYIAGLLGTTWNKLHFIEV